MLPIVGQYERAAEESSEAIRLSPDYPFLYAYRILAYTSLNRFEEARSTYALNMERKLRNPYL